MAAKIQEQVKKECEWVLLDPGSLLVIVYIGLVVVVLLLSAFSVSYASIEEKPVDAITVNDVTRGELLIPANEPGQYHCAPILSQKADIDISGMTARTTLVQKFKNPGGQWIEAKYVFPLPDESAVDSLHMVIGERRIVGVIKEKEEARKIYEKAADEGKKASLVVQKRPNIFVTSVANIGPEEVVTIEIQYQQKVMLKDGVFSLRFPMAITPRYQPLSEGPLQKVSSLSLPSFTEGGWSAGYSLDSESKIPVNLNVSLTSGFAIGSLRSLYHGITDDETGDTHNITLDGSVKADRDFVLEWEPKSSREIQAALFTEKKGDERYALLMLTPPTVTAGNAVVRRELIYILDISGSMAGKSIREAKKSLVFGLDELGDNDRFNIIVFNNNAHGLFKHAVKADRGHIQAAKNFIAGLEAEGGTEMAPALQLAFEERDSELMRQIVFITDGAVGNETELFTIIANGLGRGRLFTVGIGSAPNMYFMSRAAAFGRGTYTAVGDLSDVSEKMSLLLNKLSAPQSTGMELFTDQSKKIEFYPSPIPDLYAGEPVVIAAKIPENVDVLKLTGTAGGQPWSYSFVMDDGAQKSGIAGVWARGKIRALMDCAISGTPEEEIRKEVVETALQHHLVSKYTSLVAVEEKVSRPENADLQKADVKKNLPYGLEPAAIFGGGARTATPARLFTMLGIFCLILSVFFYTYGNYRKLNLERRKIR